MNGLHLHLVQDPGGRRQDGKNLITEKHVTQVYLGLLIVLLLLETGVSLGA